MRRGGDRDGLLWLKGCPSLLAGNLELIVALWVPHRESSWAVEHDGQAVAVFPTTSRFEYMCRQSEHLYGMPHVCTLLLLGTTHLLTSCPCMCRRHTDEDKACSSACGGLLWCVSSWAHKCPASEVWFLYPAHTGSDLRLNLILFCGSPPCFAGARRRWPFTARHTPCPCPTWVPHTPSQRTHAPT